MAIYIDDLLSKNQTGYEMHRLIEKYYGDLNHLFINDNGKLIPLSSLPLNKFFNFVKNIPYRRDKRPVEVVARPDKIVRNRRLGMDCKKKSIIVASYLKGRGYPYRLVASSRFPTKQVHHVFPQVQIFGKWLNVDATYPDYRLFQPKSVTYAEVL